ncbi:MAG: hypothetical protein Q9157_001451 [Trypethelium eluteriae]
MGNDIVLPDHDFHGSWGRRYTICLPLSNLWDEYKSNRASVELRYDEILAEYTNLFMEFFDGFIPLSFHAHVSDASNPSLITGFLLYTAGVSILLGLDSSIPTRMVQPEMIEPIKRFYGWNNCHITAPRFAVIRGAYGAAYGHLAYISKEWDLSLGAGPEPFVIEPDDSLAADLKDRLCEAKSIGCIAVVLEMVSTTNGLPISPYFFSKLREACLENNLFLIVDEALTAIRCGSPFCFQREEYAVSTAKSCGPDIVLFGKGLGLCGFAVNFGGQMMKKAGFVTKDSQMLMTAFWRNLVTQPVQTPVLIEAIDILKAAQTENWPDRSKSVGRIVRDLVWEAEARTAMPGAERNPIRGLDSMILIERHRSSKFPINGAMLKRSMWVRWLPKLDLSMTDPNLGELPDLTHMIAALISRSRKVEV